MVIEMKVFVTESPNHRTLVVFAWSIDHAVNISLTWHHVNGIAPTSFLVDPGWRKHIPKSEHAAIRRALQAELAGIGEYRPDVGWLIAMPVAETDMSGGPAEG